MLPRNLCRDGSCKSGFYKVDDELFSSNFRALSEGGTPLLQRSPVNCAVPCTHTPAPCPTAGKHWILCLDPWDGLGAHLGPLLLIKVIIHFNVLLLASSVLSY